MSAPPLRILNTEPGRFSERAKEALRQLGAVDEVEADRAHLLRHVAEYDALFVCLANLIDREIIERGRRLRCIVTPTTGVDHIDVEAARARQVDVLALTGETEFLRGVTATAELAWGLLLALVRKLPAAHQSVVAGRWDRDAFRGNELRDKVIGIVGHGRLGRMMGDFGKAFRMTVLAYDRQPDADAPHVRFVSLPELLRQSDVVSLHLPLTPDTDLLFDAGCFSRMKRGALFINTSRGRIVDESALLDALGSGHLAGAAVDVLAGEVSGDPGWAARDPIIAYARRHDNLIVTPHIGGMTHESVDKTNLFMIDKLARYLRTPAGECAR